MTSYLKNHLFFEFLSNEELLKIESVGMKSEYKKDQVLFIEGDMGNNIYIVLEGQIKLFKSGVSDKETIVKFVEKGEMFGEVVLFEQNHYPVSAITVQPSTLFTLSKSAFSTFLLETEFRNEFIKTLMTKLRFLTSRVHQLSSLDVEERFFDYLKENYGKKNYYSISLSKKDLAKIIGTTPETLSRLISRLTKQELLDWKGDALNISPKTWDLYS